MNSGVRETFRGYGHEQGYEFLRSKIAQIDYRERGIEIADDEIFSPTDRSAIAGSFSIFSATKTKSRSPIRFIRSTSIPT